MRIGEGSFIDPYDDGGLASTFQTPADHISFRAMAYKELRLGTVASFSIGPPMITNSCCGMEKSSFLLPIMERPSNYQVRQQE